MCLGEAREVARLILSRSMLDVSYGADDTTCGSMASGRMHDMFEPVLCTYIDLDRLIERCGLSSQQENIVTWLMKGYTPEDIAGAIECTHQAVGTQFRRAVRKITAQNQRDWEAVYANKNHVSMSPYST